MNDNRNSSFDKSYEMAGLFALALRLVTGWTYFSAFWRRLVLDNKLDPEAAGYIGEKFNHFLPNALLIKPGIEYLVSHDGALWWFMLVFTIVEGIVGLLFMLGLFTRLMSIGMFGLAMGILLGAGWLGTTCLDEWQIGVLGIASGFTVFLSGSGRYSLDFYVEKARIAKRYNKVWSWLSSGSLNINHRNLRQVVLTGSILILMLTLGTNQYFHGGVWGNLHNLSVRPHVSISNTVIQGDQLSFTVFRDEGADVYGSFLIAVHLKDEKGNILMDKDAQALTMMSPTQINNSYVAKVKPGKHSLVIPLGAKAKIVFRDTMLGRLPSGSYELVLTDISGAQWRETVIKHSRSNN